MIIKRQQCQNCSFSSWYNNFRGVTFKSLVIDLPEEFVNYLGTDGIILPDAEEVRYSNDLEYYSDEEDWDEGKNQNSRQPTFPELKLQVDNAIRRLGGCCFVKLNWSSPKDASWITKDGTLKCSTFNDVCLLLKSSDFVTHDLTKPYEYCEDSSPHPPNQYQLILRKYVEIVPGMEFRCFIKSNQIIGISQRHHEVYYDYLQSNLNNLKAEILEFYNAKIKGKFADSNFVVDIYKNQVGEWKLIDFNPFGPLTDPLLFTWTELEEIYPENHAEGILRVTLDANGIQPSSMMSYQMPKDMIDLSCGEDIQKMIDFFNVNKLVAKPGDDGEK